MSKRGRTSVLLWVVLVVSSAQATMTLTKRNKFDLNWWFRNPVSSGMYLYNCGYYRDYNNDGLPDYLVLLEDYPNADLQAFTLDTRPTGGQKVLPADKTAGRNFFHQPGVFLPRMFWTPFARSMDSPDLVVVGTNGTTQFSTFTRFVFHRLNKRIATWPTERTWTIDVVSTCGPQVYWPNVSYNNDDYPDFFVYTANPDAGRHFVITCHNGLDGVPLWTRTLDLDPEDPGTDVAAGAYPDDGLPVPGYGPYLSVQALPHAPQKGLSGDFDGDGTPDILLWYSFNSDPFTPPSATLDISVLDVRGNPLVPYTPAWTRITKVQGTNWPGTRIVDSDYDKDGYVDLMIWNSNPTAPGVTPPPPFAGYDLKHRRELFRADVRDFGAALRDPAGYQARDQLAYGSFRRCDVTGDGWGDLAVYRPEYRAMGMPLRVGLFNAYAGGTAQAGRRLWLQEFPAFDSVFANVNDFNGDDLLDYVLLRRPDEPGSPTAGRLTFHFAHALLSATGLTLSRQFDYAPAWSSPWNSTSDTLSTWSLFSSRFGDVDGDGQRDTAFGLGAALRQGGDSAVDLGCAYVLVYDNSPGLGPPPITAELEIQVQGEDWMPFPRLRYTACVGADGFVDNNRDGFVNDVVAELDGQAVFSLAFQYRVQGQGPTRLIEATYSDLDGNGMDAGDQVVLTLDRSVEVTTAVLRASHFSLPVAGDSLGRAGFGVGVNPRDSRQVVVTLGQGAKLTVPGVFSSAKRTLSSPSGIDFATSLPTGAIKSLDGLSAVGGPGVDVRYNLVAGTRPIGPQGGTLAVQGAPDAAYTGHSITLPGGASPSTLTYTLRTASRNLGVPGAFRVEGGPTTFSRAVKLAAEYHEGDTDWEQGCLESEMRVHQLVEKPQGVFRWLPIPGQHTLSGLVARAIDGGHRKLEAQSGTVAVELITLNPRSSLGQPGVFAALPLQPVIPQSIVIKPGPGGAVIREAIPVLAPYNQGAYPGHAIEFPGWVTTTAADPDPRRIAVRIRTATMAERHSPSGGQAFPSQSGALFVVETTDHRGVPVVFTSPVNLTVQFKERPNPMLTDVVRLSGAPGVPQQMRLVKNVSPDAINFGYVAGLPQTVNTAQGKVIIRNLTGLTGYDGKGTYGAAVFPEAAAAEHWELYP